jgi:hypothetical protein
VLATLPLEQSPALVQQTLGFDFTTMDWPGEVAELLMQA